MNNRPISVYHDSRWKITLASGAFLQTNSILSNRLMKISFCLFVFSLGWKIWGNLWSLWWISVPKDKKRDHPESKSNLHQSYRRPTNEQRMNIYGGIMLHDVNIGGHSPSKSRKNFTAKKRWIGKDNGTLV